MFGFGQNIDEDTDFTGRFFQIYSLSYKHQNSLKFLRKSTTQSIKKRVLLDSKIKSYVTFLLSIDILIYILHYTFKLYEEFLDFKKLLIQQIYVFVCCQVLPFLNECIRHSIFYQKSLSQCRSHVIKLFNLLICL